MHERGWGESSYCLPVRFLPRLRSETRTIPLQTHGYRPRVRACVSDRVSFKGALGGDKNHRKCPQINRDYHGQQQSFPPDSYWSSRSGPAAARGRCGRCGGAWEPPPWSPGAWSLELCTPSFPRRTSTFKIVLKGQQQNLSRCGGGQSPRRHNHSALIK